MKQILLSLFLIALLSACSDKELAESSLADEEKELIKSGEVEVVEAKDPRFPEVPLWGDTHLHTSYSFDVYLFGLPNATPDTAYRFAKGQKIKSPTTGEDWQLSKPLDFLVVADHAELLGSMTGLFGGDPEFAGTQSGKALLETAIDTSKEGLLRAYHYIARIGSGKTSGPEITPQQAYVDLHGGTKRTSVWHKLIDSADNHNVPGEFTAFIGWEWTSQPGGANLHRVVFTPNDGQSARQYMPFSQLEGAKPEQLWDWLDKTSEATGAEFLAIPHNSNVSMGRMFDIEDSEGRPLTAEYAKQRMKWEPVVEATQIKGDSETHPMLSPNDEYADYESYNFVMLPSGPTPDPEIGDYVRSGLRRGLEIEQKVGVNPYKFGLIGSTDSHTGISAYEETAFGGKGMKDSRPELRSKPTGLGSAKGWDMGAAGIVAAWAPVNTRESLFQAFKRKEVYASTGPRIRVRFFGGWNFDQEDLDEGNLVKAGYEKGVSMGSDLASNNKTLTPQFLLSATQDPDSQGIDRIQIVKGWVDNEGSSHERVFNVVSSNAAEGGSPLLKALWSDPEFDPGQAAFYYARVLEIPSPRYSTLDAQKLGIDVQATGRAAMIQERVYTSPIWYLP